MDAQREAGCAAGKEKAQGEATRERQRERGPENEWSAVKSSRYRKWKKRACEEEREDARVCVSDM